MSDTWNETLADAGRLGIGDDADEIKPNVEIPTRIESLTMSDGVGSPGKASPCGNGARSTVSVCVATVIAFDFAWQWQPDRSSRDELEANIVCTETER